MQNEPAGQSTGRWVRGLKERAYEEADHKQEGVLGDEPIGRPKKEATIGEMVQESSVHADLPTPKFCSKEKANENVNKEVIRYSRSP